MAPVAPNSDDLLAGFGPNERAILERVPTRVLRRGAAALVRTKERLQFTGWLQYVIPLTPTAALGLLGGLAWLLGLSTLAAVLGVLVGLLLTRVAFDIVTSKWRIRPVERLPAPRSDADVFELMRSRRSCRSFQTRDLREEDRAAVLASVDTHTAAPTFGPHPVRLEYVKAPLTVWPTVNAGEFLVALVRQPYDRRAVIDVGRVLQKVVIEATRRGLGTCWIGPGADHASLKHHLGHRFDPDRDLIICTCALGYPSRFGPLFVQLFSRFTRQRRPLSELVFSDPELTEPLDVSMPGPAAVAAALEACRWAPSSYNGQTTRAVVHTSDAGAVSAVDFVAATTSRFYAAVALGIWCTNWELGVEALGLSGRFVAAEPPSEPFEAPRRDVTWMAD